MSQSAPGGTPEGGVQRPLLDPVLVVWALTLLLGIQPLTTDLYLPALPGLKAELNAPMGAAQLTLSALILAFGFGQLALGPLADRTGRKPVLLAGLAAYVVAALGAMFAATIEAVIAWRALQGAGMAAAVVCARAMVRDLYPPHEGMRVMSRGMSGLGVIALSSPALGGVIAAWLGWRAAIAVLALFGAATLAFVLWRLPETIVQRNPQATRLKPLMASWREIAAHPTFRAYAGLTFATYAGLYTFLAGSSFVFIEALGLSRTAYGLSVASSSVAYLLGTFACRRWLALHGARVAVRRAGWCTLVGGVGMAALTLGAGASAWSLLVPQWFYAFGHGIHQPCGQAGAVGPFPRQAGAASALAGFVLAGGAFAVGAWLGLAMDGSATPVVLTIAFWSILTAAIAWTGVQRHGEPQAAVPKPA
ncbi:multidrug effflux MFS transporter [Caldimonas sp. KR1-144]|uniref:multidrug effflux MFS transporter n=1 Tax=Caldimonas sp. KR1-144 TaxID=3400911 RepID=UPI003C08FE90